MKVLLDECVTRRCVVNLPNGVRFDIEHTVDIAGLGWGAKDRKIVQYLQKIEYDLFVTADRELIKQCIRQSVKVAQYNQGRAYVRDSNEVIELGEHHELRHGSVRYKAPRGGITGAFLNVRRSVRCSLRKHRRTRRLVKALVRLCKLPDHKYTEFQLARQQAKLRKLSKCRVCGLQCRNTIRLRNHMKNDHYSNLTDDSLKIAAANTKSLG